MNFKLINVFLLCLIYKHDVTANSSLSFELVEGSTTYYFNKNLVGKLRWFFLYRNIVNKVRTSCFLKQLNRDSAQKACEAKGMNLITMEQNSEILKIIQKDVGLTYWTSNSTKTWWMWNSECVEFKIGYVQENQNPNLALVLNPNAISCSYERHSICYRENIVTSADR